MPINFPSDPTAQTPVNTFSPDSTPDSTSNNVTYVYDGGKWVASSSGGSGGGSQDLQSVTDEGNTTTNGATFANVNAGYSIMTMPAGKDEQNWGCFNGALADGTQTSNIRADGSAKFADGNITLAADGSAEFVGTVTSGPIELNSANAFTIYKADGSGGIIMTNAGNASFTGNVSTTARFSADRANPGDGCYRGNLNGATTSIIYADGRVTLGGTPNAPTVDIKADGSATFGGTVTSGGLIASQAQGLDVFTGSVSGQSNATSIISADGIAVFASGNFEVTSSGFTKIRTSTGTSAFDIFPSDNFTDPASISLETTGNAMFAGSVELGNFNSNANDTVGMLFSKNTNSSQIYMQAESGYALHNSAIEIYSGNVVKWKVTYGGTASFSNLIFNLEADDDTKYTSTTNEDGEQTLVYNGATLDVKDRLTKLDTALTGLKAALVSTTDHASLKAALIAALADI